MVDDIRLEDTKETRNGPVTGAVGINSELQELPLVEH